MSTDTEAQAVALLLEESLVLPLSRQLSMRSMQGALALGIAGLELTNPAMKRGRRNTNLRGDPSFRFAADQSKGNDGCFELL